jgi:hypothetical protein
MAIRLGQGPAALSALVARLRERTFELNEEIDVGWFSEGGLKSKIRGFPSGVTSVIEMVANADKGRTRGLVELIAQNASGTFSALAVSAEAATFRVFMEVNGINKVLLDGEGRSDYPILGSKQKTQLHFGIVTSAGAKINGTEGWTVEKIAGPAYKIKFTTAFSVAPAVIAIDAQGTFRNVSYTSAVKEITIVLQFGSNTTTEEIQFAFIAIG